MDDPRRSAGDSTGPRRDRPRPRAPLRGPSRGSGGLFGAPATGTATAMVGRQGALARVVDARRSGPDGRHLAAPYPSLDRVNARPGAPVRGNVPGRVPGSCVGRRGSADRRSGMAGTRRRVDPHRWGRRATGSMDLLGASPSDDDRCWWLAVSTDGSRPPPAPRSSSSRGLAVTNTLPGWHDRHLLLASTVWCCLTTTTKGRRTRRTRERGPRPPGPAMPGARASAARAGAAPGQGLSRRAPVPTCGAGSHMPAAAPTRRPRRPDGAAAAPTRRPRQPGSRP